MAETVLGGVVNFLETLGIFEVLLPFLLTFTIVFAILERTRVFGTEKIGNVEESRKNLNSMVAFVMGFLVIASSKLVETVTSVSSNVVILLLLGVFFLMLVGVFYTKEDIKKGGLQETWAKVTFAIIMFVGLIVIFLNAIKNEAGETWWDVFWQWMSRFWDSAAIASIILIVFIIIFIVWITKGSTTTGDSD
jgi:hypothetical protein